MRLYIAAAATLTLLTHASVTADRYGGWNWGLVQTIPTAIAKVEPFVSKGIAAGLGQIRGFARAQSDPEPVAGKPQAIGIKIGNRDKGCIDDDEGGKPKTYAGFSLAAWSEFYAKRSIIPGQSLAEIKGTLGAGAYCQIKDGVRFLPNFSQGWLDVWLDNAGKVKRFEFKK
jgi:hypothetical protein